MLFLKSGCKLIFLLLLIPVFVPFAPKMPDIGIDPSWAMALNQAVAQKLSFGKDIIFTLGPYAAIYTKVYHPATDGMMLWGSFYLACSYWLALLVLMRYALWTWMLALVVVFTGMIYVKDSLFFSYPLLLGIISYKSLSAKYQQPDSLVLYFLLFAPLGLLVFIKSSFIMISMLTMFLTALFFILNQQRKLAVICLGGPLCSMFCFWLLSGQKLGDLPYFLGYSFYFVLSFTEAMAKEGNFWEVFFYLCAALLILLFIFKQKSGSPYGKIFLLLQFALFLFLSFKTGFTRHNHAVIAGTSLIITAFLLPFIFSSKYRLVVMLFSVVTGLYIIGHYRALSLKDNLVSTYAASWYGFTSRMQQPHWLLDNFKLIMEFQRLKSGIPVMQGTADIYSYEQTLLLASGVIWTPRPIFQSYSTFASLFAEKNKKHLEGNKAADTIIFSIEPIDERLPALEDGASWPLLLKNYRLDHQDNRFVYLQKKNNRKVGLTVLSDETHQFGEQVTVPKVIRPLFLSLEIKPSWLGYLRMLFFKISQLEIVCELEQGEKRYYRLSANMAKSNFLLSPLVEHTAEFALLHAHDVRMLEKQIKSFTIQTVSENHWQNEYKVHFKVL
ncbi:MAG: hypothetical protein QM652_09445 [Legionella sp.]|uniref:hypothetical protein n=1 Tax=Legionella sp. TaxID=459 RepID=UPI0039E25257